MDISQDTVDPSTAASPRSMNYPSPKARRFRESHHLIPTPGVEQPRPPKYVSVHVASFAVVLAKVPCRNHFC